MSSIYCNHGEGLFYHINRIYNKFIQCKATNIGHLTMKANEYYNVLENMFMHLFNSDFQLLGKVDMNNLIILIRHHDQIIFSLFTGRKGYATEK